MDRPLPFGARGHARRAAAAAAIAYGAIGVLVVERQRLLAPVPRLIRRVSGYDPNVHNKRPSSWSGGTARERAVTFQALVLPHTRAGYRMARWISRSEHDAEDLLQEATLRALKYWDGWRGDNVRTWFLAIVRNVCRDWLQRQGNGAGLAARDDARADGEAGAPVDVTAADPEATLIGNATAALIEDAIRTLPPEFREVLLLREKDGLAYRQIAAATGLPMGTVMSRLARARSYIQRRVLDSDERGHC